MTTVSAGATGEETLTATSTITVTLAANESALVTVKRGALTLFSQELRTSRTIGPYLTGDVLTLTAVRGDVDYTVDAFDAAVSPVVLTNPGVGTFALQSVDGVLTWTVVA